MHDQSVGRAYGDVCGARSTLTSPCSHPVPTLGSRAAVKLSCTSGPKAAMQLWPLGATFTTGGVTRGVSGVSGTKHGRMGKICQAHAAFKGTLDPP